jgi:asparagine synthase (glutamine-hydrolysing)
MRDALLHRGPDGVGEHDAPGVSLAACRLAIVDLEPRGLMPMASADGRFTIVHNGEIYNRLELRQELCDSGAQLRTTTDTEVLLELYARHGAAMLDRLDGMFAFAIWDSATRELFAARDRVGEKPFYYAVHDGRLWFASEPKALFAGGVPKAFNDDTWLELLTFRSAAGERTVYRGVRRLLPGHWLRVAGGGVETGEWWRFATSGDRPSPDSFAQLLEDSVRRRLIADVPLGTLLSGGLDSSAVTVVAAAQSKRRLPAFTARYEGTALDEGEYAEAVARVADVEHHHIRTADADRPALIVDATWHLDEPINFLASADVLAVSRYAREHVRVLLTGETSDELFGGYARLRMYRHQAAVDVIGRLLAPARSRLRFGSRWYRAAWSASLSRAEWIAASYADGNPQRFTRQPLAEWAPYRAEVAERAVRDHREPVRQALAYERMTHLPAIVATGDRMTMAAGLEARLPFTSPALLEYAALVPPADLFHGRHGKQPLRSAMRGRLPRAVLERRKQGWSSPFGTHLRTLPPLRAWVSGVPDHPLLRDHAPGREAARAMIDSFMAGDATHARDVWMLARIVLWHQVCVEGNRRPFDEAA